MAAAARLIAVVNSDTHFCKRAAFLEKKPELNQCFCHTEPKTVCVFNNSEYTVGITV